MLCWMVRYVAFRRAPTKVLKGHLTLEELCGAEFRIIKLTQLKHFPVEYERLLSGSGIGKGSSLRSLNPFLRKKVLCVGGKLHRLESLVGDPHPMILPCHSHVTDLVISDTHRTLGHFSRDTVRTKLRERYWIIKNQNAVRRVSFRMHTMQACPCSFADSANGTTSSGSH